MIGIAVGRGGTGAQSGRERWAGPTALATSRGLMPFGGALPLNRSTGQNAVMTNFDPRTLLAESRLGVLATVKANGMPQLSPVTPFYDQHVGRVYVSIAEGRAKTANLRRDPRAALEVTRADGWAWATAEGPVELIGPGTDPHGPEVDALVDYYRRAAGEHPDWEEYRTVMVADRRVLMIMTVDHVYGESVR